MNKENEMDDNERAALLAEIETCKIPLVGGQVAIIDKADLDAVSKYSWSVGGNKVGYPYARVRTHESTLFVMHRMLMDAPKGVFVDHINGNTLDNRRANLRLCTNRENCRNSKKRRTNKSGFKGVHFHTGIGKYVAQIMKDYKKYHIGVFDFPEEAHEAYCTKAKELFGEFARFE